MLLKWLASAAVAFSLVSGVCFAESINVNSLAPREREKLVVQGVASIGMQRDWISSKIERPSWMNDFEANRFMSEILEDLNSRDALGNSGDDTILTVSLVGQLDSYDFESKTYTICVPLAISSGTGFGQDFPRIQYVFSPIYSTRSAGSPLGAKCNLTPDLNGENLNLFAANIRVPIDPKAAEELLSRAGTFSSGTIRESGLVNVALDCKLTTPGFVFGWNFDGSTDCLVQNGEISVGNSEIKLDARLDYLYFEGEASGQNIYVSEGGWNIVFIRSTCGRLSWDPKASSDQEVLWQYLGNNRDVFYYAVSSSKGGFDSTFFAYACEQ